MLIVVGHTECRHKYRTVVLQGFPCVSVSVLVEYFTNINLSKTYDRISVFSCGGQWGESWKFRYCLTLFNLSMWISPLHSIPQIYSADTGSCNLIYLIMQSPDSSIGKALGISFERRISDRRFESREGWWLYAGGLLGASPVYGGPSKHYLRLRLYQLGQCTGKMRNMMSQETFNLIRNLVSVRIGHAIWLSSIFGFPLPQDKNENPILSIWM